MWPKWSSKRIMKWTSWRKAEEDFTDMLIVHWPGRDMKILLATNEYLEFHLADL